MCKYVYLCCLLCMPRKRTCESPSEQSAMARLPPTRARHWPVALFFSCCAVAVSMQVCSLSLSRSCDCAHTQHFLSLSHTHTHTQSLCLSLFCIKVCLLSDCACDSCQCGVQVLHACMHVGCGYMADVPRPHFCSARSSPSSALP